MNTKRCRRDYCTREAVPGRNPQLCQEHHRDREERQRRTATQPNCANGCGNKAPGNSPFCGRCQEEMDREKTLHEKLDDCTSVDDLKDFIRDEILPRINA